VALWIQWLASAAYSNPPHRRLFAAVDTRHWDRPLPDWEAVEKELRGRGVTAFSRRSIEVFSCRGRRADRTGSAQLIALSVMQSVRARDPAWFAADSPLEERGFEPLVPPYPQRDQWR
jgi:hypothetical protein